MKYFSCESVGRMKDKSPKFISPWSLCERLIHVFFNRLRFHFNNFWWDVGAHSSRSLSLCLGVGFLPELFQPDKREKTLGKVIMALC